MRRYGHSMSHIAGSADESTSGVGAFGATDRGRGNFGQDARNPETEWPTSLFALLPAAIGEDAAAWTRSFRRELGALYPSLSSDASRLILTATVNDAIALMTHVDRLDGRSAAHCARALFEHLINAIDVEGSPANAQRYLDHRAVTQEQVSRRRWYLPLLSKKAQRKENARLDKLGRGMERTVQRLAKTYGSSYRRSWADGSLRDRAHRHGFGAGYDGYRILSAVIHGSSGAMSGVVRIIKGAPVHRTGPDLDLAATAYVEGLRSTGEYFDRLAVTTGRPEAATLRDSTARMLRHTEAVRAGLSRIDRQLWPTDNTPPPMALLAFYKGGRERWFVYYPQTDTLLPAEEPHIETGLLDEVRQRARDAGWVNADGRPITVVASDVAVTPRTGASPVPAGSIMIPPELKN